MSRVPLSRTVWQVLIGRLLTAFSEGIVALALVTIAVREFGGVQAGVVVASASAVGVLLGTYIGGIADFALPPRVLAFVSMVGCLFAVVLAVLVVLQLLSLVVVSAAGGVLSLCLAMATRAETAALVHLVPDDQLPRVFGAVAARSQMAAAAAGLVSGIIVGASYALAFAIDAGAWGVGLCLALLVSRRYPARERSAGSEDTRFSVRELSRGYGFILRTPSVLAIVGISSLANLLLDGAGIIIELELIAAGTDLILVGLLGTATSLSALVGSFVSGAISSRVRIRQLFALVLGVLAVSLAACAVFPNYWVILVALSVGVFLIPSLGVATATSVARLTPMVLQARVNGASAAISLASTSVSPPAFGGILALTNRATTLLIAAVGTGVIAIASLRTIPKRVGQSDEGAA